MAKRLTIGLVVPFSADRVPVEGPKMYPNVTFIPKGVGVRALTPEGYDAAWDGILPAAKELAKKGVDAIMVIGTSLTFYRGYAAHQKLLEELRRETGLPVSTMTEAVVDGLRSVGAKRIAVATAYADEVNRRLADFLRASGFEVLSLEAFGLTGFGDAEKQSEQDIIRLSGTAIDKAKTAEAVLISCGGLMTLNCAAPIEKRHGVPVVSSTQAAFWKAMRLAGDSGYMAGHGRMLEQSATVPAE
jgi:arylmalonate decarboxylase